MKRREAFLVKSYGCLRRYKFFPALCKIFIRKPKSVIEFRVQKPLKEVIYLVSKMLRKYTDVHVPTCQNSSPNFLFKKQQHAWLTGLLFWQFVEQSGFSLSGSWQKDNLHPLPCRVKCCRWLYPFINQIHSFFVKLLFPKVHLRM